MVEATLNYLRPGGPPNRRFVAPGAEINTGTFEPHRVTIENARLLKPPPTLASRGFTLLRHRSTVKDFKNADEINALYPEEAVDLIKSATGADYIYPMGWERRTSAPNPGELQPPASDVHVDLTPERAENAARFFLKNAGKEHYKFSRFTITSLWRVFSSPPQDWPLAVCDGASVDDREGEPNVMIRIDKLPEGDALFAPIEGEDKLPAASLFKYRPEHRWFFYPDMTRDEALLLAFFDSARGPAWRVPHTAFEDISVNAANPRESIEFRSVAYFTA